MISILIPVYNGDNYLEESLNSILNQSYKNFEIIIVNDGSTDNTSQILEKFNFSNIKVNNFNNNMGKVAALNRAFQIASGEFITFFAHDDIMLKDSLLMRLNALESNKDSIVYTNLLKVDKDLNNPQKVFQNRDIFWEKDYKLCALGTLIPGGSFLIDRAIAENVFPIPISLKFEDWWVSVKLLTSMKKIIFIEEPTILYRIHGSNDNGQLGYKNFSQKYKADFKRQLDYHQVIINDIDSIEIKFKTEFLQTLKNNLKVKRKISENKPTLNLKFIKDYGPSLMLFYNLIAFNLATIPLVFYRNIKSIYHKLFK